jgi:hypothetical protein
MKTVIVTTPEIEVFHSFRSACSHYGLSYHYLKARKMPFTYKGVTFSKHPIIRTVERQAQGQTP